MTDLDRIAAAMYPSDWNAAEETTKDFWRSRARIATKELMEVVFGAPAKTVSGRGD